VPFASYGRSTPAAAHWHYDLLLLYVARSAGRQNASPRPREVSLSASEILGAIFIFGSRRQARRGFQPWNMPTTTQSQQVTRSDSA
jgi:hypothetical protein